MDLLDAYYSSKVIYLKGSQTGGFLRVDNEDKNDKELEERPKLGNDYAKEYIEKEKEEWNKMYSEKLLRDVESDMSQLEVTTSGTFADCNEIRKEESTKVYTEYYKDKPKLKNRLVVNDCKTKILSMIEFNEVTVISGPTGCGKTTQIPQFILDSHAEKGKHCNIIVTQPRRIAAITIPKRVCEERDWPLGTICGYKVGLKDCTSEDTRLTYVTVGVFLQILINSKHINDYTHVILDEIHERDLSMDFALLIVRKYLNTVSRNVKVILMSATADVDKFATYFERPILGKPQPAPVIGIGRSTSFVVQIHYLEELASLGELPKISSSDPCISESAVMICIRLIKQFEKLDKDKNSKKSVLVFLPGIFEIERLFNKLKDPKVYAPKTTEYKWFPIPLHSSITAEEQALAFRPPPTGFRKVILATNIAESSITVPDVMFVIDFCLTRVLVTDPVSNFTSLQLCWASKANCIQRAGRAGRVMDGRVYRMVYKDFYQSLDEHCTPDILRCPLEKVVLQSKLLNMGSPKAVLALAVDPPDLGNIERTILILKEVGGLLLTCRGISCPYDGDLTFLGRLMALMPVDIRITRLIVLGHLYTCLEECITMGAAMSLKSVFSSPFQERLKAYNSKLDWADGSCSDCIAFLNVYDVWKMNHENGYFKRSAGGGEVGWAKLHFIQLRALKEVEILVEELTKRLKSFNIERTTGVDRVHWNDVQKTFVLKFVIAGAFYPNYFTRGARGGQVSEEYAVKILGGRDPFTTVYLQNYPQDQPPELYSHLIKEQMAECKEDMKISYDSGSKVYIEFRKQDLKQNKAEMPFSSEVPGRISMAVYRAVKRRQTMKYVEIDVLPPEQAKKMADQLGIQRRSEALLKRYSEVEVTEKLFQSILPGIDVSFLPINITYALSPGHFWAAERDTSIEGKLMDLLNDPKFVWDRYSDPPEVGEMCVAPYQENGEVLLYRGRVDSLKEEGKQTLAQIFFIDYGNSEFVPVGELRKYNEKQLQTIGKIPAQAFECVLTGVKPSTTKDPSGKGKWCEGAIKEFGRLISDANLYASIYSVVGGIVSLILYKVYHPQTVARQVNINRDLVRQGFAEDVEESYLSKSNNLIRKERQLDSEQREAYNTLQLRETWMDMPSSIPVPDLPKCNLSVKLGGPHSSLEMKIFGCTQGGRKKHIIISQDSVNSVLLDSDPQDPHDRLVVAGQISQSQNGDNLILSHTTIMPNIHGLAALVPFVFAPKIELRVNKKRTKYTGLLCGLGVDPNRKAMFPEHDMEIPFDCQFTFEDFTTVNRLRFFMSLLLLSDGENHESFKSYPDVIKFQRHIKTALMELIDRHRPSQELEYPQREFKWGLVESDVMAKNPIATDYSKISVFPLHAGVHIMPNPNEKKNLLFHVDNLKGIAKAKLDPDAPCPIDCELCEVSFDCLKSLRLHLRSNGHQIKEEKLRKSLEEDS